MHLAHGKLDDVGGRTLHGVVHGRALAEAARVAVGGVQLGDVALAAEHGFGVALRARLGHGGIQVLAHAGVHVEVAVDHVLRLAERDAQALRKAERLLAVHDAEVHGLRAAAHLGRDVANGHAEHARGRGGMEVRATGERLDEAVVARQVRKQAQLDLRVVGRHEFAARLKRHEALADAAAELRAHGDVLQVRV